MTTQARQRYQPLAADTETPVHVELAAEAVLDGWTRERVIDALIGRIRRDRGYLAYRKACRRHTGYDDQVQQDLRALALAICWLSDASESAGSGQHSSAATPRMSPPARTGHAQR
jgi:hypothetical protein